MFIFEREGDRARAGEGQREGDTESEAGSRLWAISPEPDAGLELTEREIVTWAEVGRSTDWATQAPRYNFILIFKFNNKPYYLRDQKEIKIIHARYFLDKLFTNS